MKRQKDAAQLQQLVQVMQFQKMAADLQRQAGLEQALASPEVQKQLGPNSGAITALVRGTMTPLPKPFSQRNRAPWKTFWLKRCVPGK